MTAMSLSVDPAAVLSADPNAIVAGWHDRPVAGGAFAGAHALTVDVEDYFQVEAFFSLIDRKDWEQIPSRVERNIDRILDLFDRTGAKATFFTLGWMAERHPQAVRRIVAAGHELGSHGLAHFRADSQEPALFRADASRSRALLQDISGTAVNGYRAASFSVSKRNLWAHAELQEAGYRYSSSIYPVHHDLYGVPDAPRFPFYPTAGSSFVEIPVTTARRFGNNMPAGGGGYFRLLPYWLSLMNLRSVERRDGRPGMFYFHPWEIDPDQPRVAGAKLKTRIRHYTNLKIMERRLERLLTNFTWRRVDQVFPVAP